MLHVTLNDSEYKHSKQRNAIPRQGDALAARGRIPHQNREDSLQLLLNLAINISDALADNNDSVCVPSTKALVAPRIRGGVAPYGRRARDPITKRIIEYFR
ncbi:hypothetical protein KGM_210589 [Danaus plexippus plexippus]|uniref:Uncharacterized protein n=1 Tax=Danaus plexippus plexippus TaxID=278856 RepID=A0A212FH72_DANPL|nr:hypothetical protein KGM_210589 [Danaus plexippus plexippus]